MIRCLSDREGVMTHFRPIHKHLLIRAEATGEHTSVGHGKLMLLDMVESIGMRAVTPPQCAYVDEPGNKGLTGSINLATSHVTFHKWDETGLMMIDVYSCCEFDVETAFKVIHKWFPLTSLTYYIIDRLNIGVTLEAEAQYFFFEE
jgi:S-adenosylmethionine/arginine decarboxylase-like enzyme